MKKALWLFCLIMSGLWGGCGKSTVPPASSVPGDSTLITPIEELSNRCPEITDVFISDSMVGGGEQVRIAITAVDPDNDKLYYVWSATRGELTGQESQAVWTAPECTEVGPQTATFDITIEGNDGECTVDQTITIAVNCGPEKPDQEPDAVIPFPSGSTHLNNIAKAQLDNLAVLLKQFPDQAITIEGHTDSTGNEETNQQIGLKRAESVKEYLIQRHGIDSTRITIRSYGSTRSVESNETKEGRAKNRRVEIYRAY
jgi:outer membrane protein OmpA-like peptidoglycan-associated protein